MYTHKCYSSLKVTKVKTGTCAFKGPIDATMRCHQRSGTMACAIDWHQQFTRQARQRLRAVRFRPAHNGKPSVHPLSRPSGHAAMHA